MKRMKIAISVIAVVTLVIGFGSPVLAADKPNIPGDLGGRHRGTQHQCLQQRDHGV